MKKEKMLSRSQGNGAAAASAAAFSSCALPPARRLPHQQQQQQPFYWNCPGPAAAAAGSSSSTSSLLQRKRPGCECDSLLASNDQIWSSSSSLQKSAVQEADSPLDLSVPKIKVRQHWSGGSIVEVNTESAIVSIQHQSSSSNNNNNTISTDSFTSYLDSCVCTDSGSSSTSSPVKVSVIQERRQQQQQQQSATTLPSSSSWTLTPPVRPRRSSTYSDFLRVEIQWRHQPEGESITKPLVGPQSGVNMTTAEAAASTADDDLNRLADSAHQLRLSGFYYGHLSWKESAQLLQNTRVSHRLIIQRPTSLKKKCFPYNFL